MGTTLPVSNNLKDRAEAMKREGETWEDFVARALDALEYDGMGDEAGNAEDIAAAIEDALDDVEGGLSEGDVEVAVERALDSKIGELGDLVARKVVEQAR